MTQTHARRFVASLASCALLVWTNAFAYSNELYTTAGYVNVAPQEAGGRLLEGDFSAAVILLNGAGQLGPIMPLDPLAAPSFDIASLASSYAVAAPNGYVSVDATGVILHPDARKVIPPALASLAGDHLLDTGQFGVSDVLSRL